MDPTTINHLLTAMGEEEIKYKLAAACLIAGGMTSETLRLMRQNGDLKLVSDPVYQNTYNQLRDCEAGRFDPAELTLELRMKSTMKRGIYYLLREEDNAQDTIIAKYAYYTNAIKAMTRLNRKFDTSAYWVSEGDRQEET